jgi:hypothetical protein
MPSRQAVGWWLVQVVDTTGAGDCFTGAVAVGILEGMSYQQAMKFAGGGLFSICLSESSWMLCMKFAGGSLFSICLSQSSWMLCTHCVHCLVRGPVTFGSDIAGVRFCPIFE